MSKTSNTLAKSLFDAAAVAKRLSDLKAAKGGAAGWWEPALRFELGSVRDGNQGTRWSTIIYTSETGISGNLVLKLKGEKLSGGVGPATDAALAELQAAQKNPARKAQIRLRTTVDKAALSICRWTESPAVDKADDITVLLGADGKPMLPAGAKTSPYFQVAELLNEAFVTVFSERVDLGTELALLAKKSKGLPAAEILAKFAAGYSGRSFGPTDIVLTKTQADDIRAAVAGDATPITRLAIVIDNAKVVSLIQTHVSSKSQKNANKLLPNPITRANVTFDRNTNAAVTNVYDKTKAFAADSGQKFELAKVDGAPVDALNVHKFIRAYSLVDGILDVSAVCFSNMGISIPTNLKFVVVDAPTKGTMSLDDLYADDAAEGGEVAAAPAPGTAAGDAPAASIAPEDHDALIKELSV